MSSNSYHAVYMKEWRLTHPEYVEKGKTITNEFLKNKYQNDPFYREYKKIQAKERYYKIKQLKLQQQLTSNNSSASLL